MLVFTLRNSTVGRLGLTDVDRVILQVKVNIDFTDSVLFLALLIDSLLEVGVESQDL
jgi:hypothetical protein